MLDGTIEGVSVGDVGVMLGCTVGMNDGFIEGI
jgi:hypothetical protein